MPKSKILEAPNSAIDLDHLSEIKSQNDIAQLDREWTIERENYMISDDNGLRRIPTRTTSVLGAILVVGFGLFWTITAGAMTGGLFALFGVIFIIFGAGFEHLRLWEGCGLRERSKKIQTATAQIARQKRARTLNYGLA